MGAIRCVTIILDSPSAVDPTSCSLAPSASVRDWAACRRWRAHMWILGRSVANFNPRSTYVGREVFCRPRCLASVVLQRTLTRFRILQRRSHGFATSWNPALKVHVLRRPLLCERPLQFLRSKAFSAQRRYCGRRESHAEVTIVLDSSATARAICSTPGIVSSLSRGIRSRCDTRLSDYSQFDTYWQRGPAHTQLVHCPRMCLASASRLTPLHPFSHRATLRW
ncbi:hypothetical protein BD413DRAFT_119576 [Trametes elegans]|nr:hypothetical protein BD413DRAFT_119576 [Trametes elegans]